MEKSKSQSASITRNLYTYLNKLSVIKEIMNVKTQNLIYCSTKSAEGTVDGLFPSPSSPCTYPLFFIIEPLLFLISDTVFVSIVLLVDLYLSTESLPKNPKCWIPPEPENRLTLISVSFI